MQRRKGEVGVVLASGEIFDVVTTYGGASLIPAIAVILIQWLRNKASRKVMVQSKDNEVMYIEGMSPSQVIKVPESAKSLSVIQTESDDTAP